MHKLPTKSHALKIGGEAGFGVMAAGLTFSKVAVRHGFNIFNYVEYPSLIRGGHNVIQTTFSTSQVMCQNKCSDVLIALNQETIDLHKDSMSEQSIIIYDSSFNVKTVGVSKDVMCFDVPLLEIAKSIGTSMIMRNSIALAAAIKLLGGSLDVLLDVVAEQFAGKGDEVLRLNTAACKEGFEYAAKQYDTKLDLLRMQNNIEKKIIVTGNEACAMGAISAGLQFAAIYPMTPTSNILHTLAPHQEEFGYVYKQPEDEISAINMAIGASFAGARSMVATSGGGFCLMTEGYGLAGITETPIVIIEGMRGSPATGLPTWTEQGDLRFVLSAHQGDFPRIVLAPGDVTETFNLTSLAFNLADKYQTPVVVLMDKFLCESHMSVPPFKPHHVIDRGSILTSKKVGYERYADSASGISERAFAGTGNSFVANSDEHDTHGYSEESARNRITQMQKRMRKLQTCEKEDLLKPVLYGNVDAPNTLISWGSNKGVILEAMEEVPDVNFLHVPMLNPFPAQDVKRILENAKGVLSVECNYSGQFTGLIAEKTGIQIKNTLFKYDGRPIYKEEVVEALKAL